MKMETVIRSPQKGVIAKLVHKQGVCCLFFRAVISLTHSRISVKLVQYSYFLRRYAIFYRSTNERNTLTSYSVRNDVKLEYQTD